MLVGGGGKCACSWFPFNYIYSYSNSSGELGVEEALIGN